MANSTKRRPMWRLQLGLAPRMAKLHSQCMFQKNVEIATVATGGDTGPGCAGVTPRGPQWHKRSVVSTAASSHANAASAVQVLSTSSHAATQA